MLFQEYDFKICVKLGKSNVKPNYLSWRWNRELEGEEEGDFPNANMFKVPPARLSRGCPLFFVAQKGTRQDEYDK